MYRVKLHSERTLLISDVLCAEGFEHNSRYHPFGDIAITNTSGVVYTLEGRDAIARDHIDTIIDFINEIATEPALITDVPAVASQYIEYIDSGVTNDGSSF